MTSDQAVIAAIDAAFAEAKKPDQFLPDEHQDCCVDFEKTLRSHSRESLRVEHVGNVAWDPFTQCSPQGLAYFIPNLVRFALAEQVGSPYEDFWFLLHFRLEPLSDGRQPFLAYCTVEQRRAIASLLRHLLETRADQVEGCADQLRETLALWTAEAQPESPTDGLGNA